MRTRPAVVRNTAQIEAVAHLHATSTEPNRGTSSMNRG
jgi:hypothetical protein